MFLQTLLYSNRVINVPHYSKLLKRLQCLGVNSYSYGNDLYYLVHELFIVLIININATVY